MVRVRYLAMGNLISSFKSLQDWKVNIFLSFLVRELPANICSVTLQFLFKWSNFSLKGKKWGLHKPSTNSWPMFIIAFVSGEMIHEESISKVDPEITIINSKTVKSEQKYICINKQGQLKPFSIRNMHFLTFPACF